MSKTTIIYEDVAPGAAEDADIATTGQSSFSEPQNLVDGNTYGAGITCELNSWLLNGTRDYVENVPLWSSALSGEDCALLTPVVIDINFDEQYTANGISLGFCQDAISYGSAVNIKWYQQGALKEDADFTPNAYIYFCDKAVESFDRIVITINKTSMPYTYCKLDYILFGVSWTFDMTKIRNAKITEQISLISDTISIGELDWELENRDNVSFIFQLKQPMTVKNDNKTVGVFYIDEHERLSALRYKLKCHDAFGILDTETFQDGVYTSYSAKQLLSDIVDGSFPIVYDDGVPDKNLTGILQGCTKRQAIQQVAFAWCVCITCEAGAIRVFLPGNTPTEIGENRVYTGVSISTRAIVTAVQVIAHQYTQDSSGNVEINGTKYSDTKTVYTVSNPNVTANDKQNIKTFASATLVSNDIAQNVAQHIYNYYTLRDTASGKIVWNGEKLGDCVTLPNAWGKSSTGNIQSLNFTISNTIAANAELQA